MEVLPSPRICAMPDLSPHLIDEIIEDLQRANSDACKEDEDYRACREAAQELADQSGSTLRQAWEEVLTRLPAHERPRIQILDVARAGLAKALMHRWKPAFVLLAGVDFVRRAWEKQGLPPTGVGDNWDFFCRLLRRLVTASQPSPVWVQLSVLWAEAFDEVDCDHVLWDAAHDLYCAAACIAGQEEDRRWLADCLHERWHFQKVCTEPQDRWTSLFVAAAVLRGADSAYDGLRPAVQSFVASLAEWGV